MSLSFKDLVFIVSLILCVKYYKITMYSYYEFGSEFQRLHH